MDAIKFGVIGSGSWATALVKILSDNEHTVHWWVRNEATAKYIIERKHNPHYIPSANLQVDKIQIHQHVTEMMRQADVVVLAVPSAYIVEVLNNTTASDWNGKLVISAIKGILPEKDILLNQYLEETFNIPLNNYFAILGPCHAEEVAAEKLSYLTLSGLDVEMAKKLAKHFNTAYINTIANADILGVQYAAVLKNIYALGAGIAHGLDYGDNFLSVYIANCADEMAAFLRRFGAAHIVVGEHEQEHGDRLANYAASVYLGDLLVTCYSLHSRNRTFGNMIGKGYSVQAARLELNMVAEGYNASKCMYHIHKNIHADMPIAATIYKILWEKLPSARGFKEIEKTLI